MSVEIIGKQIAAMRKERGIKQEELANYVGVTVQAVSKWENGGVPDTDLLPKIADFFSVSVDTLFGRTATDYNDLHAALISKIHRTPPEERLGLVFNYCWDMERALMVDLQSSERDPIENFEKKIEQDAQHYSSFLSDHGFTRMGIANRLQYFLIVPEPKDTEKAFFGGVDYPKFFEDFSDPHVFGACVLLSKRDHKKAFTPNLLVKKMGISQEKATEVLEILAKYRLISSNPFEMDDEVQTIYTFSPSPSFIALLIFAREMIRTPRIFSYHMDLRKKPYLH